MSMAEASQEYFRSATTLLEAVDKQPRSSVWLRKTAQRIESLQAANVDPDLLAYSTEVCGLLRGGSDTYVEHRLKSDARQAKVKPRRAGNYHHYDRHPRSHRSGYRRGWSRNANTNYGERRRIKAEEDLKATESANEMIRQVAEMTSDMKAQMISRYKIAF